MKYFIIAGEQSGDLHGSNLVKGLLAADDSAEIACWGGDLMENAGARLLMHYRKTAFMGFVTVLKNIRTISGNFRLCKKDISEFNPDVLILIDYPGFNLRMAEWAKKSGLRVFYYISPKLWAWNEKRVIKVKKFVDRMFIIFPFEVGFYARHGIEVKYAGNPLVDEITEKASSLPSREEILNSLGIPGDKPIIGMMAGSRRHEIELILPQMLKVIKHFPGHRFVLAGVKNIPDEVYRKILGNDPVILVKDKSYEVLSISDAALVKSGTSTLEAALLGIPEVVCYRGDFFSMLIAWAVIKVKYISLVNLIMNEEIVRELVQFDLNEKNIKDELKAIISGGTKREEMLSGYQRLKEILGPAGASGRIAAEMVKELKS